ncbi:glutathione S-transferase U17-like [Cornus florida]|uniref:glutathione S-transferase U17-like n=1 Tax=Cornus florida TaxID=4283 RepID=UPI002896BEA3|nr:glutathione S-transferase U17-like [Cornus florida]
MATTTTDVKLLGTRSSLFVNRVQIALNIKSVKYEFLKENLRSKSELLLESNPANKKIPVLIHGDKPICESLIIVRYIDEVWSSGPSILPSDPYDRAIARFWAAYIDDKWFPLLKEIWKVQGEEAKAAATEQVVAGLVMLEEAFVRCSKGKAFFGGDSIGYLDIAFGSFLGWLMIPKYLGTASLLEIKTPRLMEWAERFCSDGAVKNVFLEPEKLIETITEARANAPTSN